MHRPTRRLAAALLWIAIALLPLRGLAASWMPVAMSGPATVAGALVNGLAAAMPCHGGAVDARAAPSDDASAPDCSMCELCHASALASESAGLAWSGTPDSPPRAGLDRAPEPRAPDSLFRPPRPRLA
jgi:hypothetical protein